MPCPRTSPAALVLGLCLCGGPLAAQTNASTEASGPGQDTVQAPSMPDAPRQFEIAARVAWQFWGSEPGRGEVEDSPVYGISLERLLLPYLSLRLSGLYGGSSISRQGDELDINQWIIDLALLGRLPIDPLASVGVIPYAGVLGGAVVHDPVDPELITRSQTALGFGAGIEIDLASRLGVHLDWRHVFVQLEDILDPQNREAKEIESGRIGAALLWRF